MKSKMLWSVALVLVAAGGLVLVGCGDKEANHGDHDANAEEKVVAVNTTCPIMPGNKIDPNNVPANLVRTFKGQKIGFCCGGCPGKWDKLTDEQRAKKLAELGMGNTHSS